MKAIMSSFTLVRSSGMGDILGRKYGCKLLLYAVRPFSATFSGLAPEQSLAPQTCGRTFPHRDQAGSPHVAWVGGIYRPPPTSMCFHTLRHDRDRHSCTGSDFS